MIVKRWFSILAVIAVSVGLAYTAFKTYRDSQSEYCYACRRPIHQHSRTVALVKGRARMFCCPACALSEHEQESKPIRVTELTDFLGGAKLSPDQAFLVKGSDVNMCARTHPPMYPSKRPTEVPYDRCSPSLLAFAHKSDALAFAREHGGQVLSFSEIVSEFTH